MRLDLSGSTTCKGPSAADRILCLFGGCLLGVCLLEVCNVGVCLSRVCISGVCLQVFIYTFNASPSQVYKYVLKYDIFF